MMAPSLKTGRWRKNVAGGVALYWNATAACLLLASSPAAMAQDGEYASGGTESCLECHDARGEVPVDNILRTPHGLAADERTPMAAGNQQCQTCHGPSQDHLTREEDGTRPHPALVFDRETPAEDKNRPCLECHQRNVAMHWTGSTHHFEEVSCTDCHTIHVDIRDPVLAIETQPVVCFECHQRQRAELLRPNRHPVQTVAFASETGLLGCTDCHTPHGGPGPSGLNKLTLNETCYDCHAEKRGPFLWEHAPVREDCTNCHVPHGSVHASLLKQRPPWLCQQCHSAQFHPSGVRSGLGVPPAGADQNILGQACANCHTNVHGSNHPSGVRFTR